MTEDSVLEVLIDFALPRGLDEIRGCLERMRVRVAGDDFMTLLPEADVLITAGARPLDAPTLAAAKRLRWVQFCTGGVRLSPELVGSPIEVTCLKGCFNVPAAEFAVAGMLAFARKLQYDMMQRPRRTFEATDPRDIQGKTVGIIGFGNMGAEIAKRCRCFGMRVLAVARGPRPAPEGVEKVVGPEGLPEILPECDFVLVAVPVTPETEGMIGGAELACMKRSAHLIDISGRPVLYDLEALAEALRSGTIAGAQLQIVPDDDSPLWDIENLIISFHRVVSREADDLCIERICENLRRYREGRPLFGAVDKTAGF
jgi:phosphoglycerate dehydrogenase-like enzyme